MRENYGTPTSVRRRIMRLTQNVNRLFPRTTRARRKLRASRARQSAAGTRTFGFTQLLSQTLAAPFARLPGLCLSRPYTQIGQRAREKYKQFVRPMRLGEILHGVCGSLKSFVRGYFCPRFAFCMRRGDRTNTEPKLQAGKTSYRII